MKGRRVLRNLALVVLVALPAGCGTEAPSGVGLPDTIKIGLLVPLTGKLAQPGQWVQTSVKYAVEEINAAGGIGGKQVEVIVQDDGGDPTQDVTLVNRLINQDQVQFIFGPITTDGMKAVVPIETEANIASIGVVGSPTLTPAVMPYGFSVLLNAGDQAVKMAEYARDQEFGSVAVLHDSGEQGRTAGAVLKETVSELGMTLTGVQQYDVGATDVSAQLLSLKRANPKALLLFPTTGEDVGHVLLGMQQLGLSIPVVGGYAAHFAPAIAKVAGKESLSNLVATAYSSFGACKGEGVPERTQEFAAGLERFDPKVFEEISIDLAASTRDGVWIMKAAIEGTGSVAGDKIATWLEQKSAGYKQDLVNAGVSASSESHFLFAGESIGLVRPAEEVAKGVFERVDC